MKRFLLGLAIMPMLVVLFGQMKPAEKDFEGFFTYEMKTFSPDEVKGQKSHSMNMTFYLKGERTLIDLKDAGTNQGMKILIDRDKDVLYQLMEANNQKMAMRMDLDQIRAMNDEMDDGETAEKELKTQKTGKTKSILGYQCNQRKIEGEDLSGHVWVTKAVNIDMAKVFKVLSNHPRNKFGKRKVRSAYSYPFKGFVMESTMQEKKSNPNKIKTRVTELKAKELKEKRFDISDYQVMDMNGGMNRQNEDR